MSNFSCTFKFVGTSRIYRTSRNC